MTLAERFHAGTSLSDDEKFSQKENLSRIKTKANAKKKKAGSV